MSDNKRLIDGDTVSRKAVNDLVKKRLNNMLRDVDSAEDIEDPFDRGKATAYGNVLYDFIARLPSIASEGEATRLREALERIKKIATDDQQAKLPNPLWSNLIKAITDQALSPNTEDTGIQKVRELWEHYRKTGRFISARAVVEVVTILGITIPGITEER